MGTNLHIAAAMFVCDGVFGRAGSTLSTLYSITAAPVISPDVGTAATATYRAHFPLVAAFL